MIRKELSFVKVALFIFLLFDVSSRIESQVEEVGSSQFYHRLHISNPNQSFGIRSKSPQQTYRQDVTS